MCGQKGLKPSSVPGIGGMWAGCTTRMGIWWNSASGNEDGNPPSPTQAGALGKVFPPLVPGPGHGEQPFVVALRVYGEDSSAGNLAVPIGGFGNPMGNHPAPLGKSLLRLVRRPGPGQVKKIRSGKKRLGFVLPLRPMRAGDGKVQGGKSQPQRQSGAQKSVILLSL